MGYNTYTTSDLVSNILLTAHVPTGNSTFTSADLITLASRELQTPVLKQIMSTRGGYYKSYTDYQLSTDGLYMIPADCVMGALDNVEIVVGTSIIPVSLIEESEQLSTLSPSSTSYGFFMRGNYVQILPFPQSGVVRLWYVKRPSRLVAITSCAQVTAIATNVISVSSVPSTYAVGSLIDAAGDQPPFNTLSEASVITGITGTDITLDAEVTGLAIGDWLCLNKQTCIPQLPVEFRILLEQRVVVKVYELQGYAEKLAAAKMELKELEESTFGMISPRVQSKTKVISPTIGGFLSGNRRVTNFPASR